MNLELEQSPEICVLKQGDVRLVFRRTNDRWCHEISFGEGGPRSARLWSVEGSSALEPSPSPAFQDLHLQAHDAGCYEVQLLGQAGKAHYSGAILFDAERRTIDFDLAVRLRQGDVVGQPLSTYAFEGFADRNAEDGVELDSTFGKIGLEVVATEGHPRPVCLLLDDAVTPLSRSGFAIGCVDRSHVMNSRSVATVRWRYRLVFGEDD